MATRKDLYAKFGETAEAAQLFETASGTVLLGLKGKENNWHLSPDPAVGKAFLNSVEKSTLGHLLKQIDPHIQITGDMPDIFKTGVEVRNRLFHGFYERHNFKIQTDEGRDVMIKDLEQMHNQLVSSWQAMEQIGDALWDLIKEDKKILSSDDE